MFKQNKNRNKNWKKRKGSSPLTRTWSSHTLGHAALLRTFSSYKYRKGMELVFK